MQGMDNDDIANFLGSLDYVFTYLGDIDMDLNIEMPTIQTLVEKKTFIDRAVLAFMFVARRQEYVFDQVLRNFVKKEWCEESFPVIERTQIVERFILMTFSKQGIAASLRNIDSWITSKKKPSPTDIDGEQEQNNQKKGPKSVETSTAKVTSWMGPKGKNPSTQVKVIQTSGAKAKKRIA
ncbi:unnamed protein product [Rotaria magnacalcarata]|uniref:Uncharacterized protein n=1 Tax=Rotaria magnacalcarata TaxID=392030 RepID=A0A8S3CVQ7_9BILA|nr:unnamed protein product [Rotaria magnacalcarata]CAF5118440.1 unnamed protein product [Rotaria magnacalcarata]